MHLQSTLLSILQPLSSKYIHEYCLLFFYYCSLLLYMMDLILKMCSGENMQKFLCGMLTQSEF